MFRTGDFSTSKIARSKRHSTAQQPTRERDLQPPTTRRHRTRQHPLDIQSTARRRRNDSKFTIFSRCPLVGSVPKTKVFFIAREVRTPRASRMREFFLLLGLCIVLINASSQPLGDWVHYLSFCIVFKDEAPFLREWIEFHRIVGVDKFYFYSNDSKDKYKTVLKPYIASGVATLIEWPTTLSANGKQAQTQCLAYANCLKEYGSRSRWMGFFDVDEFLFPTNPSMQTLWPVLQKFEKYGGLVVRNALYGSSGYINAPQGLVIENYVYRAPLTNPTFDENEDDVLFHIKSIVDARHGIGCGKYGAHVMFLDDPTKRFLVNERFERHNGTGKNAPKGMAYVDLIRYNHYKSKSVADWNEKKAKGTVQGAPAALKFAKLGNQWTSVDRNDVFDDSIYRFLPQLRKALGLVENEYPQG